MTGKEYSVICWFYGINCSIALLWLLQLYTGSIYKAALEGYVIMAHISVSNHFKRQENTLSDKDSGSQGSHMQPTGHVSQSKSENEGCCIIDKIHAIMLKARLNIKRMSGLNLFSFIFPTFFPSTAAKMV